jgi:hypothetical protein
MSLFSPTPNHFSSDRPQNFTALQEKNMSPDMRLVAGRNRIDDSFSGYTDDFYNQRAKSYIDFAMPRLSEQYRTKANQMGFGFADRGTLGGSGHGKMASSLGRANAENRMGVVDSGVQQAQDLRGQIEQYKAQLLNQLYQGARPGQIDQQAMNIASMYKAPNMFSPVGNMFETWAGVAGKQPWFGAPNTGNNQNGGMPLGTSEADKVWKY